jgi:hypothetical protein
MGSTYANVTVVGAGLEAVRGVLAGTGAHLAGSGDDVVVFSPHDEEQMGDAVTAQLLSVELGAVVIDVVVFDDDFVTVHVLARGEITAAATAPPNGAEIMGEMAGDPGSVPGAGSTAAATAAALVAAVGRGDATKLHDALVADYIFASESHHAIFAALDLPTIGVGWGHRYLEQDRELFDAVPLVTA